MVGCGRAAGTVEDFDPPEQAATVTPKANAAAAAHRDDQGLTGSHRRSGAAATCVAPRYVIPLVKATKCCPDVCRFRYAGDMYRLEASRERERAHRRGRALYFALRRYRQCTAGLVTEALTKRPPQLALLRKAFDTGHDVRSGKMCLIHDFLNCATSAPSRVPVGHQGVFSPERV